MCRSFRSTSTVRRERRKASISVPSRTEEKAPRTEWVVVDFDGHGFRCERCGATESVGKSILTRVDTFSMRGEAFRLEHENCKEPPR